MADLTPELAFACEQELRALMSNHAQSYLMIGKLLLRVQEEKHWDALGYKNFTEWCSHNNLGVSWSYKCAGVAWLFRGVEQAQFVIPERLRQIESLHPDDSKVAEWVDKALELPPQGFADEIRSAKGQIPHDECQHLARGSFCKDCGKRFT